MEIPETRYAQARDGVHVAYQVFGAGGIDLVLVPGFVSHVEWYWESPKAERMLRRVSSFSRVIMFDKRGTGLSDRTPPPDLDAGMLDMLAVMDAAGSDEAVIVGMSEGGAMSMLFAATHPRRTSALVVWDGYASTLRTPDHPIGWTAEQLDAAADMYEQRWGTGVALSVYAPTLADDPAARHWWARLQRFGASPAAAAELVRSYARIDVRAALPLVHAPTLVIHRRDDRLVPIELGREVANGIPNARMVELVGADHLMTVDPDPAIDAIAEFVVGVTPASEPERVLATVLFTDIVSSTELASKLGDQAWRELLDRHDGLIQRQVGRHGGRVVKTTGDGVLALFDGPTRAVQCAHAITDGCEALGISVRAGLHTAEITERSDGDVSGIAVNMAQRVSAEAQAGEVLVSRTIVDLVAGSGLNFTDRGPHTLKGAATHWHLYAAS